MINWLHLKITTEIKDSVVVGSLSVKEWQRQNTKDIYTYFFLQRRRPIGLDDLSDIGEDRPSEDHIGKNVSARKVVLNVLIM
jgi:hypothetical protein